MININEIPFEVVAKKKFKAIVAAVGYENRASYLSKSLNLKNFEKRFCVKLVEDPNDVELKYFVEENYDIIEMNKFKTILIEFDNDILIDFSVMMKSLYAGIVHSVLDERKKSYYFSYTHSKFEKRSEDDFSFKSLSPILLTPDKIDIRNTSTTTLIISLGYERLTAIGLIESLEINYENVIVLMNKSNKNDEYYYECIKSNSNLISLLKEEQIIPFNFFNFEMAISVLDSILFRLYRENKKVIISPMSVKTFSLISMVLSLKYPNVIFYNASSHSVKTQYLKNPNPEASPIIYQLNSK